MNENFKHQNLSGLIIHSFYKVYNTLGYGFLEKVYENALKHELIKLGLQVYAQVPIQVHYDNVKVGHYCSDLIIDNKLIIEIKAAEAICEEHLYQLTNYLKASEIEVGLLLNFGKEATFRRRVFSNKFKS